MGNSAWRNEVSCCSASGYVEISKSHADAPSTTGTGKSQRYGTLGDHAGTGRLVCGSLRLGRSVAAENVFHCVDLAESSEAIVNGGLAKRQPTTLGRDSHFHRLAVVAGDGANTGGLLIEDRPARHRETHLAIDRSGGVGR